MYRSDGDVDGMGDYARVRTGVYGKSLYLPLNFAMNLKLLPPHPHKIRSLKKVAQVDIQVSLASP